MAPPFGGFLYEFFGKAVPFVILAGVCLLDGMLLILIMRPMKHKEKEEKKEKPQATPIWRLLIDPHIACCAGTWMVALQGFAGMRTAMQADTLTLSPRLPAKWSRLAFPVRWQGCPMFVDIRPGEVEITNRSDMPCDVSVWGRAVTIPPGQGESFQRP